MTTALYLSRRLLQAVAVIVIVTIVVFCLLHALPGGPARGMLGVQATPEQIAAFNHDQGLDRSLPVQYALEVGRLLRGDLGTSYTLNAPVSQLIAQRLPKTLVLTIAVGAARPADRHSARHVAGRTAQPARRLRAHGAEPGAVLHAGVLPRAGADRGLHPADPGVSRAGALRGHAGRGVR